MRETSERPEDVEMQESKGKRSLADFRANSMFKGSTGDQSHVVDKSQVCVTVFQDGKSCTAT